MKDLIYLDYNGSTPVDPAVLDAITSHLKVTLGNPSSFHAFGRKERAILTQGRDYIAKFFGFRPEEVIFTSGATEGMNLLIRGFADEHEPGHIITSSVEHSCVYSQLKELEAKGWRVTYLQVGAYGAVKPEAVKDAIRDDTKMITLISANNETGVKTDVDAVAQIAKEYNIPLFVDAVAEFGKEPLVIPSGVSGVSLSGHKIYAPKGIGLVVVRRNIRLSSLIKGGPQQFERRAGTENIPGIVAMAEAIKLIDQNLHDYSDHMKGMRDRLEQGIMDMIPDVVINGDGPRVANTANLAFLGVDGETLLTALDMKGVAVTHGSACSSGSLEPSRILLNMGYPRDRVLSSIRFSVGRPTTAEDIDRAVAIISEVVTKLRD